MQTSSMAFKSLPLLLSTWTPAVVIRCRQIPSRDHNVLTPHYF